MPAFHRITSAVFDARLSGPTSVVVLDLASRPANITWLVIAVVVDAVKREFRRRSESYVGNKGFKAVAPSLAHLDTTASVVSVIAITWAVAPVLDVPPDLIFWSLVQPVFSGCITDQAAARLRFTSPQTTQEDIALCSADAATQEISHMAVSPWRFGDDNPAAESGSSRHVSERVMSSHSARFAQGV